MNPACETPHFGGEAFISRGIEHCGERAGRQRTEHLRTLAVMIGGVVRIGIEVDFVV